LDTQIAWFSESLKFREDELGGSSGCFALLKALAAEYRTALRGFERDGGFTLAPGANCLCFYPLIIAAGGWNPQRLGALAFAVFATLGFIFELLIMKEKLFTGSENEVSATIDTLQNLILELHLRVSPFFPLTPENQAEDRTSHHISRRETYHGFGPTQSFCSVSYNVMSPSFPDNFY